MESKLIREMLHKPVSCHCSDAVPQLLHHIKTRGENLDISLAESMIWHMFVFAVDWRRAADMVFYSRKPYIQIYAWCYAFFVCQQSQVDMFRNLTSEYPVSIIKH